MNLEIRSVPTITLTVYWTINLIKYAVKENETFKRFIPLVSAILGEILGIICFYAVPEIIFSQNVFIALITGGASGLSATGCNQIIKQLGKRESDDEE